MRPIDADAVYDLHVYYPMFARSRADLSDLRELLKEAPTLTLDDLRPKGRWFWADDCYCRCSECKQKAPVIRQWDDEPMTTMTNFCPNCGADMRGGGEDE